MKRLLAVMAAVLSIALVGCIPEKEPNDTVAQAQGNNFKLYDTLAADRSFSGNQEGGLTGVDRWILWTVRDFNPIRLIATAQTNSYVLFDAFACLEPGHLTWEDCPQNKRIQFVSDWLVGTGFVQHPNMVTLGRNQLVQVVVRHGSPNPTPNPGYIFRFDSNP